VKENFVVSAHGKAIAGDVKGAPNCLTCHRNDITNSDVAHDSLTHKITQEKLCLSCHLDNPDVKARTSPTAGFIAAYETSVHGSALLKGNAHAANCVDCHGSHEMKKGLEPSAKVNKMHIAETCSKCHGDIFNEFSQSVHGAALTKGNLDAPTCTNCHGEHNILKHTDPRSPIAAKMFHNRYVHPVIARWRYLPSTDYQLTGLKPFPTVIMVLRFAEDRSRLPTARAAMDPTTSSHQKIRRQWLIKGTSRRRAASVIRVRIGDSQ